MVVRLVSLMVGMMGGSNGRRLSLLLLLRESGGDFRRLMSGLVIGRVFL